MRGVDESAAMDSDETLRKFFLEIFERFVDEVFGARLHDTDVFSIGTKHDHVVERDEPHLIAEPRGDMPPCMVSGIRSGDLSEL